MCKKIIYLMSVLVLSVICSGYADVVIGDWENGSYDGWIDWGAGQVTIESIGAPKYTFSDIGATLGSSSLKMSPGSGWQQNLSISLADVGGLEAFMSGTAFAIDVTYNSADWDPATTYAQVYQVSFNNNSFGWHDVGGAAAPTGTAGVVFTDTLNPDSPGAIPLVDPGTEGTVMTGTWTWDYSGVLDQFTLPEADAYIQIVIATNSDAPGAYYFDNARIIGAELPKPVEQVVLLEDDFEGDSLDLTKWQVLNGPDVNIVQAGGQVFFDRPQTQPNYLITAEQYDPSVTPLTITGSAITGPEGLAIWTRAGNIGNTGGGPAHVLDSGIRIPLWPEGEANGWYDGEIIEKLAGTWPWTGLTAGNIPGAKVNNWEFVITDDGTTITATFTQSDDPTNTFTLVAEDATKFETNYVAITVINGYLNDVKITTLPAPKEILLEDDFGADTIDLTKWQVLNGPDVNIVQADGQIFFDRPQTQLNYLITAEQYNPSVTPLTITGSAVTGSEGLAVWTRASNIGNTAASAQHVLDHGIRIPLWPEGEANGWYDGEIIEKLAGTWPWSGLTVGNIPGAKAYNWDFVITDDGTTITATWTQSDDPTNTFTLTAEDTTQFDTNYVAFTVINGYLNEVTISTVPAGSMPIEVENFSFELPGTAKIKGWNGEGSGGTPAEDIPGWASDTAAADSGVESDWPGSTDGVWSGYIMGGDPSVWNLTDQVIGSGEEYLLQIDLQDNYTDGGEPQVVISLYYDDAGTRVTVASETVTPPDQTEGGWTEFSVSFVADDAPDSIGKLLGIEIDNTSATSWVGMDNVRLNLIK